MGPTASGKSTLAERLADELDAVLINADSFQVYRGFDIGTAKPECRERYKLIDIKNPDEQFGVGEFVELAHGVLQRVYEEGRSAVVVGGTGLNIRALFEEYADMNSLPNPELRESLQSELAEKGIEFMAERLRAESSEIAEKVDLKNPVRVLRALEKLRVPRAEKRSLPPYLKAKVGILTGKEVQEHRITIRLRAMLENGFVSEVERILASGTAMDAPAMRAIGYRPLAEAVQNKIEINEAISRVEMETRQYAKRQRTWLRSEPNLLLKADVGEEIHVASLLTEFFRGT